MVHNVLEFGAVSDGVTVCTKEIQKAIDSCEKKDVVLIPEGVFCCGALFLKSNMTLQFEQGAKLLGSKNTADYPILRYGWEGREHECYASLLNTMEGKQECIRICGCGVIDANGMSLYHSELDEEKGKQGRCICLRNVSDLTIEDVVIRQSPAWCLHLLYCDHVRISRVEVHTKYDEYGNLYEGMINGDGIDIDSCRDVLIEDSMIASEDDCIALKSGRDEEGRKIGIPTENVEIRNCIFRYGFGVAVGSEMSGGVKHVNVHDCAFEDTYSFASVKAPRGRGGIIDDITYKNITHSNHSLEHQDCKWFRGALYIDQFYSHDEDEFNWDEKEPVNDGTAIIRNIHFENVTSETVAGNGIYLCGLPEQHLQNITFKNVTVKGLHDAVIHNVDGLVMEN